jgi:hypothetical protein
MGNQPSIKSAVHQPSINQLINNLIAGLARWIGSLELELEFEFELDRL